MIGVDQEEPVRFDPNGACSQNVSREARALSEQQRGNIVLSIPLRRREEPLAGEAARPRKVAIAVLARAQHHVEHAARPEALIYEPGRDGLGLVGVEYIVIAAAWDAKHKTPPTLMGQVFHYNTAPNRYGIPAFYALHVWAWRDNPSGPFADWNSTVSCRSYRG